MVPHLGLVALGGGTLTRRCEGGQCGAGLDGSADYSHLRSLVLGADFLWQVTPLLRLGPGLLYTVETDLNPDNDSDPKYGVGPLASLDAVTELSIVLKNNAWLVPRLKFGISLLSPDDELEDTLDEVRELCAETDSIEDCDDIEGVRLGVNGGAGVGVLYALSETVRLRLDALLEVYYLRLYSLHDAAIDQDLRLNASGTRAMLLGGMEF